MISKGLAGMGQYWVFANLDKKQTSGHLGKLGEFYGSEVPTSIMWLLAIPSKPITADLESGDPRFGSWAGDRVICLGDYAHSMPDGVLTEAEKTSSIASSPYSHISAYKEIELYQANRLIYPNGYDWVLRNLTKKEFVRASAITLDEYPGHLHSHPSLGQALMTLICWSDDPSASMNVNFEITRGDWAGDRFDIRPLREVEEEIDKHDWMDISEAVAERICENAHEIF